jgi:hypothetical protein
MSSTPAVLADTLADRLSMVQEIVPLQIQGVPVGALAMTGRANLEGWLELDVIRGCAECWRSSTLEGWLELQSFANAISRPKSTTRVCIDQCFDGDLWHVLDAATS